MERITSHQVLDLMEAYQSVYAPQEDLNEEVIWEEVESWVNSLVEEGYDLSEYTWEEMYEEYLSEYAAGGVPGSGGAVTMYSRRANTGGDYQSKFARPRNAGTPSTRATQPSPGTSPGRGGYAGGRTTSSPVTPYRANDPRRSDTSTTSRFARPMNAGTPSSVAVRATGGASTQRPPVASLPSSARQVTQYPQGVSTGVGGGNAGASRPAAAPARPVARPSAAPAPAASRPPAAAPARPVARPSAAPAPAASRPPAGAPAAAARPVARPSAAPAARPAAGAPSIARPTSQAPSASPAATTGNPPLAPKPLPPITGKPSLASQATELRAMQARSRQRQGLTQSFDPFDVVLGHLIDEGYADNEESALQIMTNMSEEWRESIIEGFKPTNYNTYQGKKYDQINKQSEKLKKSGKPGEASALHMVNRLQDEPSGREENVTKSKRNRMKPDARARRDAQRDEKEDRKGR